MFLGGGGVEDVEGDFKEVRFMTMLLDELNIWGGLFKENTFIVMLSGVCEGGKRRRVNIIYVCGLCQRC